MKIGLVVPGFSADASDWCIPALRDLVERLALREELRVFALRYPRHPRRYDLFGASVTAIGGGTIRGPGSGLLWARTLSCLISEHRRSPFDLLHVFWGGETGALAAAAGSLLRVPVVLSLAGGELAALHDIAYGGQLASAERLKTRIAMRLSTRITVGSYYLLSLATGQERSERASKRGSEKRRARSEADPSTSGGRASCPPSAVPHPKTPTRVPLGVDTTLFRPHAGTSDLPPRLVQVASLVPVKDQATLIASAAILRDRGCDFRLEIAGSGPLGPRLRHLAARFNLGGIVSFRGDIPHDRLPAFYVGAAAYVQSSLHEAQGLALLEAAACGIPAVGSSVGTLAEMEPWAAQGCEPGDPESLAAAIEGLLSDRQRPAAMGRAARTAAEEEYGLERCVERFRRIYAELA